MRPPDRRAASGRPWVRSWDLETGKLIRSLEGHGGPIRAVAITPDGRRALTSSDDRSARLWDLETGETVRTLEGHGIRNTAAGIWTSVLSAISPDGRFAVT